MRQRKLSLFGCVAGLTVLVLVTGFGASNTERQAQPKLLPEMGPIVQMFCEQNCRDNYRTCEINLAVRDIRNVVASIPGAKPGPSAPEGLPYGWPFGFSDPMAEKKPVPESKPPSCASLRDTCLARCLPRR
jgi:hypothetical protein